MLLNALKDQKCTNIFQHCTIGWFNLIILFLGSPDNIQSWWWQKAKSVQRKTDKKETNKRPVFAVRFDPRLPSIPNIGGQHNYLTECSPSPPLQHSCKSRQRQFNTQIFFWIYKKNLFGLTSCLDLWQLVYFVYCLWCRHVINVHDRSDSWGGEGGNGEGGSYGNTPCITQTSR